MDKGKSKAAVAPTKKTTTAPAAQAKSKPAAAAVATKTDTKAKPTSTATKTVKATTAPAAKAAANKAQEAKHEGKNDTNKEPESAVAVHAPEPTTTTSNTKQEHDNRHKIGIRQLNDEIYKDASNIIKETNKWPIVIDTDANVARTFFRHTEANYINCLDFEVMHSDSLRKSLLGAIRYGKPFVLDIESDDSGIWKSVRESFDKIQDNLLENLMNKSLFENEKFLEIRKPDDGPEYDDYSFNETDKFKFIVLSSNCELDEDFLNSFSTFAIE